MTTLPNYLTVPDGKPLPQPNLYPIPPMLVDALGYDGPARFVAVYWEPAGDEARINDGRVEQDANWKAYLTWDGHITTLIYREAAGVCDGDAGSSETTAAIWWILDRTEHTAQGLIASEARQALRQQWADHPQLDSPLADALKGMSPSELFAFVQSLEQQLRDLAQPDPQVIMTLMREEAARIQSLQEWLDDSDLS